MIFIDKNSVKFPDSLNSEKTNKRRLEVIEAKEYCYENKFDSRYKTEDVKSTLKKLYNNKCAYCESRNRQLAVEHFRPKSKYYWLAFSWDNLLLACSVCNGKKSNKFGTEPHGENIEFQNGDINRIHELAATYNEIEKNLFVHVELDKKIEDKLKFNEEGEISSDDKQAKYTIKECDLNENNLKFFRKKVFEDYICDVEYEYFRYLKTKNKKGFISAIKTLSEKFIRDANNSDNEYLAFRRYAIKNFIIKQQ